MARQGGSWGHKHRDFCICISWEMWGKNILNTVWEENLIQKLVFKTLFLRRGWLCKSMSRRYRRRRGVHRGDLGCRHRENNHRKQHREHIGRVVKGLGEPSGNGEQTRNRRVCLGKSSGCFNISRSARKRK